MLGRRFSKISALLVLFFVISIFYLRFLLSKHKAGLENNHRIGLLPNAPLVRLKHRRPKLLGTLAEELAAYTKAGASFEDAMRAVAAMRQNRLTGACLNSTLVYRQDVFNFEKARNQDVFQAHFRPRLLVSDQHKFIYCSIGATGSENWESIIQNLELGMGKDPDKFDLRFAGGPSLRELWDYRDQSISYRIQNYFKFTVVREPLTRLISAYKQIILPPDGARADEFASNFKARFSSSKANQSMLQAFVDYVLEKRYDVMSPFWSSFHELCMPCHVPFDFIGRYENIREDSRYILANVGVTRMEYTDKHVEHSKFDLLAELRDAVPEAKIKRLFEKFKLDYQLFGYPEPS